MMNILNGGKHAENSTDLQEFLILPVGAPAFRSGGTLVRRDLSSLKKVLHDRQLTTNVGDEGGFAPSLGSNREALDLLLQAIETAGYKAGQDVFFGIDAAASEFYENGSYTRPEKESTLSADS